MKKKYYKTNKAVIKSVLVALAILVYLVAKYVEESPGQTQTIKTEVTLSACVDGDTAKFIQNKEEITVRFLGIDTPETKHPTKGVERFGPEASDETCSMLTNAKKIELVQDPKANKDKYNRSLYWILVDDTLLQEHLLKLGLAKVAYIYDDYLFVDELEQAEELAKNKGVGIWGP